MSRVQASSVATGIGSTASVSLPSASTSGNTLVAIIGAGVSTAITIPPGWFLADTNTSLTTSATIIYRTSSPSISTLSVTLNSPAQWLIAIVEYSDISGLDNTAIGTSGDSGTVATSSANEWLIAGLTASSNTTFSSPGGGFTLEGQASNGVSTTLGWLDQSVSSTGSYAASIGSGTNGLPDGGVIAAFVKTGAQPVGTATGIATATAVGSSLAASTASSTGLAGASGVGASTAASVGSATGLSTASAVAGSIATGSSVASATGLASVSGVGSSIAQATGWTANLFVSDGAVGASTASATFTVSGEGSSVVQGIATFSGSPVSPTGTANGSSSSSFISGSIAAGVGTANGDSSANSGTTGGLFKWMPPSCPGCCGSPPPVTSACGPCHAGVLPTTTHLSGNQACGTRTPWTYDLIYRTAGLMTNPFNGNPMTFNESHTMPAGWYSTTRPSLSPCCSIGCAGGFMMCNGPGYSFYGYGFGSGPPDGPDDYTSSDLDRIGFGPVCGGSCSPLLMYDVYTIIGGCIIDPLRSLVWTG